jgi:hypothetical protein
MRRFITLVFALALLVVSVPAAGAATGTLDVEVGLAPIVPDGTVAGEITDFVLTFADRDPAEPGISLKTGGTVTVTLPDDFVNIGAVGPNLIILLQGWPQSPPAGGPSFLWDHSISGNSITATLTSDYEVGVFGPGAKQAHLILNAFRNPSRPGMYDVHLEIDPDPATSDVYTGTGRVHIIPKARPSINAVSVFSGVDNPPPPPFNNPIYQTVTAGDDAANVGLYLWDKGSSVADLVMNPYLGVDIHMKNLGHGLLRQGNKTVGHVWIDAPAGADDYGITTAGPSYLGLTAVSALDTGILETTFHTDGDVTGDYTITFRMNNGNTQKLFVTAE